LLKLGRLTGVVHRRWLRANPIRAAFDLRAESAKLRDRYGRTKLGGRCLLARRLAARWKTCATAVSAVQMSGIWLVSRTAGTAVARGI